MTWQWLDNYNIPLRPGNHPTFCWKSWDQTMSSTKTWEGNGVEGCRDLHPLSGGEEKGKIRRGRERWWGFKDHVPIRNYDIHLRRRNQIIIGSAEALPILCVRCARWERERDTERDGSDVTIVTLKLAISFALFLAKNVHLYWRRVLHFSLPNICTLVSPLLNSAEFTLSIAKNAALFDSHSS